MGKRFIHTDLFRSDFTRGLEAPYKLLWVYLLCECDHAGIWRKELDVAGLRLGFTYDEEECLAAFQGRIVARGGIWHIPDFVIFQYGETLNPKNRVHQAVLTRLGEKGLPSPSQGATEGATEGAKEKEKEKEKEGAPTPEEVFAHAQACAPKGAPVEWVRSIAIEFRCVWEERQWAPQAGHNLLDGQRWRHRLQSDIEKEWRQRKPTNGAKLEKAVPMNTSPPPRDLTDDELEAELDRLLAAQTAQAESP